MLKVAASFGLTFLATVVSSPADSQTQQSTVQQMNWEAGMAERLAMNCKYGVPESCATVNVAYARAAMHARRLGKKGLAKKYERAAARTYIGRSRDEIIAQSQARASANAALADGIRGLSETVQQIADRNNERRRGEAYGDSRNSPNEYLPPAPVYVDPFARPAAPGSISPPTSPSYGALPNSSSGSKVVPVDQYGRDCGSTPTRLPDHTVTGSGHIVYRYLATNRCNAPITIRYRFDNSSRLSFETVPASGQKEIQCMNYKGSLSGSCNGSLVDYRYER
jgi:hypothetical protein